MPIQKDLMGGRNDRNFSGVHSICRKWGRTAQQGVCFCQQHFGAKWFCHIVVSPQIIAFELIVLAAFGRQHDNGKTAHFSCHFADRKAVKVGHHNIQYHQIHRIVFQYHQRIHAVIRHKTGMTASPHIFSNNFLHILFIFNNQDIRHSAALPSQYVHVECLN